MRAIEFLSKNRNLNIPMIEALEKGESTLVSFNDDGVVTKHECGIYQLSLVSDKALLNYRDLIEGTVCTAFGAQNLDYIAQAFPIKRLVPCVQIVYTYSTPLPVDPKLEFKLLDVSYAEFIYNTYKNKPAHIDKIIYLLERNFMYGVFVNGEIAGYCGRHEEGSMGLLEILPKFRRQGLGREMEKFVINKVLEEGRVPYGHVEFGNEVSMSLQRTIDGFVFCPETALWLGQKKKPVT